MIRDTSLMDEPVERRRSKLRLSLVAGTVALALVIAAVAGTPLVRRWARAERSIDRSRLRLATVTRGDLVHEVAVQGRAVAGSRPTLFSPSTGIASVRVREGARVSAGEVLAVVESPELESRLDQELASLNALRSDLGRLELSVRQRDLENRQAVELARVRVEAATRGVGRAEELAGLGLLSATELEAARDTQHIEGLELEQARQKVELEQEMLQFEVGDARLRLERQELLVGEVRRQVSELTVRAPFAGLVATVSVEDRDAVVRGQALLGVVDLSALEVEVNIPEAYADDVAPGTPAVILVEAVEHPGTLTMVAPEVRESQVAGRVTFDHGTPPGLRQNQRLSTRLVLDRRSGVLKVPRGPFLESGGSRSVYAVEDGLAVRRPVEIGVVSVSEGESLGGLEEGDEIVLSDLSRLDGAETVLLRN